MAPIAKLSHQLVLLENYIGKDCARYPRPLDLPTMINSAVFIDEDPSEINAPAIYKDMQESPKDFFYGGKSVYERFQGTFDAITELEEVASSQKQEDEIEQIKNFLRESIKLEFIGFLHTQLGDDRTHLNPTILLHFSRKASTAVITRLNEHTQTSCNSILSGPGGVKRKIELHIPAQGSVEPIEITSDLSATFDREHALAQTVQLDPKIQMVAKGVFSIPLQGQAQHRVEILLSKI